MQAAKCTRFLRRNEVSESLSTSMDNQYNIQPWLIHHAREVIAVANLIYARVVPTPGSNGANLLAAQVPVKDNHPRKAHKGRQAPMPLDDPGMESSGSASGTVTGPEDSAEYHEWDISSIQKTS